MLRVNAMITGLALGEEVATQSNHFSLNTKLGQSSLYYKTRAKFFIRQN
jgi:hypothetical protein